MTTLPPSDRRPSPRVVSRVWHTDVNMDFPSFHSHASQKWVTHVGLPGQGSRRFVGRSEWLSYPLQSVTPLREMKGMLPNRFRPLVLERRVGAVGRCTENYELLAANHRLLSLNAFGAELETRLGVHRTEP